MTPVLSSYSVGEAIDQLGFGKFQWLLLGMVGFANVADAMEMMILSILAPALHCHWHISQVQQASLTTVVFLGMMLASPFWGTVADKFGRRGTLIWASFFLFYFGLLTTFSPSFNWVLFLRFMVGFFIGGMPQACTLFVEYLPSNVRGQSVLFLSFFWAIGSCFEALLAWMVMPTLGWRYLVAFSTLPLFFFVCLSKWLPESPMFLSVTGRYDEVDRQMKTVARINGNIRVTEGQLRVDESAAREPRGRFADLFTEGRAKLTCFVFVLWFVAASTYYGIVLLSTELLNSSRGVCLPTGNSPVDGLPGDEEECSFHKCQGLLER